MSTVEVQHTLYWFNIASQFGLRGGFEEMGRAFDLANKFMKLSQITPIYTFGPAPNLPYRGVDGFWMFVSCNKRDMQPNLCDTALADSTAEAYEFAFADAEKYGETCALINGESFEF